MTGASVCPVLRRRGFAQVGAAIVKAVAVNVVRALATWKRQKIVVHPDLASGLPDVSHCVVGVLPSSQRPAMLTESGEICGVDNGDVRTANGNKRGLIVWDRLSTHFRAPISECRAGGVHSAA